MTDYAPAFRAAAELGLGRTVHAGEGRPAAEIRTAIETLHAQRIGHGTTLLDDPAVLERVVSAGITIEACPTSNVHTGVIRDVSEHPLATWLAEGVRACVCPDNTLLSDVSASAELARVVTALGLDDAQRATLIAHGHAGAFAR